MGIKRVISNLNICSATFSNVYLRMDGDSVTRKTDPGAGVVNCQVGASAKEVFKLTEYDDQTYTIESMHSPGVFLRMDGAGVTKYNGPDLGTVNCQFGAYAYEHFKIHKHDDGTYNIESAQFPNVFLRMDGTNVKTFKGSGSGSVTCQFGASAWEAFRFSSIIKI